MKTKDEMKYAITESELSYLEEVFNSQFEKIGTKKRKSPMNAMNCFEVTCRRIRSRVT